jgi:hypothetical protein
MTHFTPTKAAPVVALDSRPTGLLQATCGAIVIAVDNEKVGGATQSDLAKGLRTQRLATARTYRAHTG